MSSAAGGLPGSLFFEHRAKFGCRLLRPTGQGDATPFPIGRPATFAPKYIFESHAEPVGWLVAASRLVAGGEVALAGSPRGIAVLLVSSCFTGVIRHLPVITGRTSW